MIPLREIARARSGDKGNSANIAVFGRTPAAYAWLRDHLTAEKVRAYFGPLGVGTVVRYDVPNLEALNFVLADVLAGGGSRSLRIDAQGKTLGMALLEMPVDALSALNVPSLPPTASVGSRSANTSSLRATLSRPCPHPWS